MLSALVYSSWTNKEFKLPLITSGVLLSFSNLLYASAYAQHSVAFAMVGRGLTGLGGPRGINRRYIADTTPLDQRTAMSAAFVGGSALGMSVGPGLAVFLENLKPFEFHLDFYGKVEVNGLTGPGFVMFIAWAIYVLFVLIFFREPERIVHVVVGRKASIDDVESNDNNSDNATESSSLLNSTRGDYYYSLEQPMPNKIERSKEFSPTKLEHKSSISRCLSLMTIPVYICMMILFVNKLGTEMVISSLPMITHRRFDWSVSTVGLLSSMIGLLVVPIAGAVAFMAKQMNDRELLKKLTVVAAFGMFLLVDWAEFIFGVGKGGAYFDEVTKEHIFPEHNPFFLSILSPGPVQYALGVVIVFSALQGAESVVMSTLSKVVSPDLAAGTFNSGLLSTEVGTLGRAVGDAYITIAGLISRNGMDNLLFVPGFAFLATSLGLIVVFYEELFV